MDSRVKNWLEPQLGSNSLNSYMTHLRNIEGAYGDLDAAYDADGFASLIESLRYTSNDERAGRPNPSKLQINSHLYKTLASLRTVLRRYADFKDGAEPMAILSDVIDEISPLLETERTFSLEKDLESALRKHIDQLESGLTVIDGGMQRKVPSGFIDILARDAAGTAVVIELKAVKAPRDDVAQVLAYMGDIMAETAAPVRGILVAPDFDAKAIAAASMVPSLALHTYAFTFSFTRLP